MDSVAEDSSCQAEADIQVGVGKKGIAAEHPAEADSQVGVGKKGIAAVHLAEADSQVVTDEVDTAGDIQAALEDNSDWVTFRIQINNR